jgi:steroid delta-isomerase-like uncharacterized protein
MSTDLRIAARLETVDEHIRQENQHDLAGIMRTFGVTASFDDEPWNAHYVGAHEVQGFYAGLLQALPELHLDVQRRHVSDAAVILEVVVRGRHLGLWRGLPPTARRVELPLCGIFTFDDDDRLAGERAYFDRATLFRQLGVFHEPDSMVGRVTTAVMHPFTMARALGRMIGLAE